MTLVREDVDYVDMIQALEVLKVIEVVLKRSIMDFIFLTYLSKSFDSI